MLRRELPESDVILVGYSYLISHYSLFVPMPRVLSAISQAHKKYETVGWQVFTLRHLPEPTLYGNLVFALRYEVLDLAIFSALFKKLPPREIESLILNEPASAYARRVWFLFEYLTGETLSLPDSTQRSYIDLLDDKRYYVGPSRPSKRHQVNNNLSGVRDFCPLITRTQRLDDLISQNLSRETQTVIGKTHPDLLTRASSFLLLEDSKASYAIEGETPSHSRAERWGQIIGRAGKTPLSRTELEQLQAEVIIDSRFIRLGYRREGGFIGRHDRITNMPLPSHISARPEDIAPLIEGMIATMTLLKDSDFPPVLSAALIAFGFVFIHPFEDGNGRLHRYLLHHVLIESGFTPEGIVFPISATILKHISSYRTVLEAYSKPRLPFIEWRATAKGNVEVLNDTYNLYRFFDATIQAEFLYEAVHETITQLWPEEITYLRRYDEMKFFINNYIDMPDRLADLMIRFLYQNDGKFSARARRKEFSALTDAEAKSFETKFADIFGN